MNTQTQAINTDYSPFKWLISCTRFINYSAKKQEVYYEFDTEIPLSKEQAQKRVLSTIQGLHDLTIEDVFSDKTLKLGEFDSKNQTQSVYVKPKNNTKQL